MYHIALKGNVIYISYENKCCNMMENILLMGISATVCSNYIEF
jgi:hypothetical protein